MPRHLDFPHFTALFVCQFGNGFSMGFNPIKKIKKLVERSYFSRRSREKFLSQRSFQLGEQSLEYTIHPHNYTWTNERAVEISIAKHWIESKQKLRTLEVGNVTRHYFNTKHDVVDKYEKAPGIINVDIVDYAPEQKYQFIISISTLEHVGWDRDKKEPEKIDAAVHKLKELLAPGGELLVTVPVGFNCFLDEYIENQTLKFDSYQFLKRINAHNEWQQADWKDVKESKYNEPYFNANAIAVAHFKKAA